MNEANPNLITIHPGDPEVQWILKLMIFTTGPIAHDLRAGGQDIPRKAEDEQFAVFIWMLKLYQEHGPGWREKGEAMLKEMREKAKAAQTPP